MDNLYNFTNQVAWKTLNLLVERKALLFPQGVAFYLWERPERVVVAFDPSAISLEKVNADFVHALSTRLHGRLVVRTNSRGVFFQVGREIPKAAMFDIMPLDLSQQPSPWHMPIGLTTSSPLWISLMEGDSFLIGGSRGGGKSGEVHGMIQALLRGGKTEIHAADGKRGAEFGRYLGDPNFRFMGNPKRDLAALSNQLAARLDTLRESGQPNILMHNAMGKEFITPICIVIDEIAELDDATKELIKNMVKLYRAAGLYPILATNDPVQSAVLVKTNLATRICFRVPSFQDSLTVLGQKGAEDLPQTESGQPGRGLLIWKGRLTEFQSFRVDFPRPSEEALRLLVNLTRDEKPEAPSSIEQMAESIRMFWTPGMSKRKVAELFVKPYAGAWTVKIDKILEYLSATTTINQAESPI